MKLFYLSAGKESSSCGPTHTLGLASNAMEKSAYGLHRARITKVPDSGRCSLSFTRIICSAEHNISYHYQHTVGPIHGDAATVATYIKFHDMT